MARNAKKVQYRGQRRHEFLRGPGVLPVFHHQDIIRPQICSPYGVWGWNLHFFSVIEVRHSTEWHAEPAFNVEVLIPRSHWYSKNAGITSEWKALLLNKVVVGKGKKQSRWGPSLTETPEGYDSVSFRKRLPS